MIERAAGGDASEKERTEDLCVLDRRLDAALEETFPASDPPAILGDASQGRER